MDGTKNNRSGEARQTPPQARTKDKQVGGGGKESAAEREERVNKVDATKER